MPATRHRQGGFTLTELSIAVALMGVLTMIALAYGGERRAGVRAFADQLSGEIETVRLRALSTRRWHRVTVSADGIAVEQATTVGMVTPTDFAWIGGVSAPAGVRVVAMATATLVNPGAAPTDGDGFAEELRFAPDGSSVARTVWVSDLQDRSPMRVAVFGSTGRARVYEGW